MFTELDKEMDLETAQRDAETAQRDAETAQRAAQFLTTEQFTLQGAISGTISETNSQTSSFLSAVSAAVVALAFVAQITGAGMVFYQFSLVLFPILLFLGLSTFTRLVHLSITSAIYTKAMNRIRNYYTQEAPAVRQFLILSPYDDPRGIDRSRLHYFGYRWTVITSNAGQVAVINSVLLAVFSAILALNIFSISSTTATFIGVLAWIAAFAGHQALGTYMDQRVRRLNDNLFPSPPGYRDELL